MGIFAVGVSALFGRSVFRRRSQDAAASAAGLVPVADLSHLPATLQHTALWSLADGGFERRVAHGTLSRAAHDIDITAFDLETLRERRGEWAYLPVEPPFRIGGVVSVVVCEVDRMFSHVLLKHAGHGDDLQDDSLLERGTHVHKLVRDGLRVPRSYAADLPKPIGATPIGASLPADWRGYGNGSEQLVEMLAAGLGATLARAARRDLVVELVGSLIVVYPAARDVEGADAFADLTTTALAIVDGVLASSPALSPRGIDVSRP